jgi:DNA-binding NarL/FixJ family response regulator
MSSATTSCVLIADRHHALFEGIRGLLETHFDKVFLVTDKASLIEGAVRLQPTVIVMDLSYAAGNLPDLVRELRHCAPATKLLLLSVHDEAVVMTSAMAAGVDGFVVKRTLASDLMPAIDAVLAGHRYFFSSVAF